MLYGCTHMAIVGAKGLMCKLYEFVSEKVTLINNVIIGYDARLHANAPFLCQART